MNPRRRASEPISCVETVAYLGDGNGDPSADDYVDNNSYLGIP